MSNIVMNFPAPGDGAFTWGFSKYPVLNTTAQETVAFRGSTYVPNAPYAKWHFEFDIPYLRGKLSDPSSPISVVMGTFMAMKGRADTFLFFDATDFSAVKAQFGLGDGTTTAFQLSRPIGPGIDIIQNLNGTPQIFVNGSLTTPLSIGTTGIVTFSSAPAANAVLTWSGNFYFRCRFTDDAASNFRMVAPDFWDCSQLAWESQIL